MKLRAPALLVLALSLTVGVPASAAEMACRFEGGVLVVAASVADVAGDFILDTGAAATLLHATRAGAEGITPAGVTGAIQLGGLTLPAQRIGVADLDVRTWNLPTPVAGVIGVDALRGRVLDVTFAPCRVRLSEPEHAPHFAGVSVPVTWDAGRPVVEAMVSDGVRRLSGPFILATGANAPVRLADDLARAPGVSRPAELYPQGVRLARLPALALADQTFTDLGAGLTAPEGDVAGVIGGPVLAHFRWRFDFAGRRARLLALQSPRSRSSATRLSVRRFAISGDS